MSELSLSLVCLRWLNTVFLCALADVIWYLHKDYKNKHAIDTVIILFVQCLLYLLSIFPCKLNATDMLMVLVFYDKGMLEKATMQRT